MRKEIVKQHLEELVSKDNALNEKFRAQYTDFAAPVETLVSLLQQRNNLLGTAVVNLMLEIIRDAESPETTDANKG